MRYLKRFFIFLVIAFTFWFVDTCIVKADTSTGEFINSSDGSSIIFPSQSAFWNNNGGALSAVNTEYYVGPLYSANFVTNADGYGGAVSFVLQDALLAGYVYSLSVYIGATVDAYAKIPNNYWNSGLTIADNMAYLDVAFNNGQYNSQILYSMYTPEISYISDPESNSSKFPVGVISYIFVARYSGKGILVPFTTAINHSGSKNFYGYTISNLGLYTTDLNNTISTTIQSSGLASAQSVQQVQNSITVMQEQITQNQNEIKDSITSEDGPSNLDSLGNTAGWLPPGPVDSILTLPLNLLQNITRNLSGSCSPISLPLPYVNKNLELPCINTIYSQINGLSTFINSIAYIISGLILYSYFLKLYKWVDQLTSMKETNTVDDWGGL